jgi:glycosyltransferase involved in cell wall biosynthesis
MRRVLLVSALARRGGAERALATLARGLPAAGWAPRVALAERGPLEDWLDGAEIHHAADGDAIARLAGDVDVVLANKWRGQLLAGPAARTAGRPCVWWQHDFPDASPPELLNRSSGADVVVCAGDAVLAEQRLAAPSLRAVKIPYGIAVDEVAAQRGAGARVRAHLGVGDAPLIGIAGRLAPGKRQDVFLRAAARVAAERPEARFVVIGGDILGTEAEYAVSLPALAQALGIADRVGFAGDRPDAYAWIDALDVLAHAADREPFGLVIIEALVLGTQVVAVGAAGPAEILDDRRLVPPGDADALARGILDAVGRPATAAAVPFTATRMAAGFARLFDEVAA